METTLEEKKSTPRDSLSLSFFSLSIGYTSFGKQLGEY